MPVAVGLPTGYPWVLAATSASMFVNLWQVYLVSTARMKAGVKYPQFYATKEEEVQSPHAKIFNCKQRAHQNYLEYAPSFVLTCLVGGLRYPRITVAAATVFLAGRVAYTLGYATGTPSKRLPGYYFSSASLVVLLITSTTTVFNMLYESGFQL